MEWNGISCFVLGAWPAVNVPIIKNNVKTKCKKNSIIMKSQSARNAISFQLKNAREAVFDLHFTFYILHTISDWFRIGKIIKTLHVCSQSIRCDIVIIHFLKVQWKRFTCSCSNNNGKKWVCIVHQIGFSSEFQ